MTIAARQQRVLSEIECTLRGTDPRLAAKFGMFSWLTSGEEMPKVEQLTSPRPRRRGSIRIGQVSVRLWVVLCMTFAAGALAAALLPAGGAPMRLLHVMSARGYSLQSGGAADYAAHRARPAAANGPRPRLPCCGPRSAWREPPHRSGTWLGARRQAAEETPAKNKPHAGMADEEQEIPCAR